MNDCDGNGDHDEYDGLMWDDEANSKRGFTPWTAFAHQQLGAVEPGGFYPKFSTRNSPAWQLESWIAKESRFNLAMAKELPQIDLTGVSVTPVPNNPYEVAAI